MQKKTIKKTEKTTNANGVSLTTLLGALTELKKNWDSFHKPDFVNEDETIQWALNELSDKAHTHLLAPVNKVIRLFEEYEKCA